MNALNRSMIFLLQMLCMPLSPITIYATKPEVAQYKDRLDFINITEIAEAQAMMEMVRHEYIGNLQHVSTDIMRECTWTRSFGTNNTFSTAMLII
jgi:hypothetical protein